MDIFLMYIWTRIDALKGALVMFGGGLLLAAVMITIAAYMFCSGPYWADTREDREREKNEAQAMRARLLRYPRWLIPLGLLVFAANVALPSRTDVAIIVAGTAAYRVATSDRANKVTAAFAEYIEREALAILEKNARR